MTILCLFWLFGIDVCKPDWSYFSGICYSTSQSCKNWTEAQKTCQRYSANLITVKTQEENVYVQHRLNGEKGWIGLNDRDTEGKFVWAGNQSSNFTYWAPYQPNDFRLNEDCVHTLGAGHSFMWNDVSCGGCHNFTCSEGKWLLTFVDHTPLTFALLLYVRLFNRNVFHRIHKKMLRKGK